MKRKFNLKMATFGCVLMGLIMPISGCTVFDMGEDEVAITINTKKVIVDEGDTFQLDFEIENDSEYEIEINDEEIATVSETGLITGLKQGTTYVVIKVGDKTKSVDVEVVIPSKKTINGKESKLVWNDEFSGSTLDSNVWGFQLGVHDDYFNDHGVNYWGNNEKQAYTDKNAKVENGNLVITAKRENCEVLKTDGSPVTMEFTSSRVLSRSKKTFKYGYIESKFKVPTINGMWPAFWMMPEPNNQNNTQNEYGGWCSSGEIDIFEARGSKPKEVLMTLHFGSGSEHKMSNGSMNFTDSEISDWHTYAVNWREDVIEWYIDDVMYHSTTSETWYSTAARDNPRAPFDKPFYILFNLAVGGNFDNNRMPPSDFQSADMLVDYIRYYE